MANERSKDFNAMLHDSKDMPKFQTITDERSIRKYGELNPKYPGGIDAQRKRLEAEGHIIIQRGRKNLRYYVKDYESSLFDLG